MKPLARYILTLLFMVGILECQAQVKTTNIEQLENTKWKLAWKRTLDSVSFSAKEKTYILHFKEKQCVDFYYGNEKMGRGRYRTRRNGFVSIKPDRSCKKANEKYMINPPYGNNPRQELINLFFTNISCVKYLEINKNEIVLGYDVDLGDWGWFHFKPLKVK